MLGNCAQQRSLHAAHRHPGNAMKPRWMIAYAGILTGVLIQPRLSRTSDKVLILNPDTHIA